MDTDEHVGWTLEWLEANDLTYVCVDMPQGFPSSVPPVVAATSKELAVIRFHHFSNEFMARRPGRTVVAAAQFDVGIANAAREQAIGAPGARHGLHVAARLEVRDRFHPFV